jgi:four helix bundle protein
MLERTDVRTHTTAASLGRRPRMQRLRGNDIFERFLSLNKNALKVAEHLRRSWAARHMAIQLLRAASGAGANYQEARYAESRADFIHKVSVATKEAGELLYWLSLVAHHGLASDLIPPMIRETEELIAILVASGKTARANQ